MTQSHHSHHVWLASKSSDHPTCTPCHFFQQAWAQFIGHVRVITLVKRTGLWGSNVLGHGLGSNNFLLLQYVWVLVVATKQHERFKDLLYLSRLMLINNFEWMNESSDHIQIMWADIHSQNDVVAQNVVGLLNCTGSQGQFPWLFLSGKTFSLHRMHRSIMLTSRC